MCGNYMGVHCGSRANDCTSNAYLKGNCSSTILYQCPAANVPAQEKGYCSYCANGDKPGIDYCAIGRSGINMFYNHKFKKRF
jgi:hypothetical protein